MLRVITSNYRKVYKNPIRYLDFMSTAGRDADAEAEWITSQLEEEEENDSVAVVGGANFEEEGKGGPDALRETDSEPVSGLTDEVVEARYGADGEDLSEAVGDRNVLIVGGTVANPMARLAYSEVEPGQINEVSWGEIVLNRKYPVTFDGEGISGRKIAGDETRDEFHDRVGANREASLAAGEEDLDERTQAIADMESPVDPETQAWYEMTVEEFRKDARPNYVLDRSTPGDRASVTNEYSSVWVPTEEGMTELGEQQRNDLLSKRSVPVGNGDRWQTDYGVLTVDGAPDGEGNMVGIQGAHGLATEELGHLVSYDGNGYDDEVDRYGTEQVLEELGEFREKTGADEYQAITEVSRNPATGDRTMRLVAVGEL